MTAVVEAPAPPALGVHDWTAEEYHGDPVKAWGGSVSSTVLRNVLWPDGSPAQARHKMLHGEHTPAMDEGTVAHRLVLGAGGTIRVLDATDWKSSKTRALRDAAYADGGTAVLRKEFARIRRLSKAVLRDPDAGPLFRDGRGVPERSVLWVDDVTGRYCRAMLDRFPNPDWPGRPLAVDLKKTQSVRTRALKAAIRKYRYDQQAAWYLDGLATVGLVDAGFVFVFVEANPPHHVRTVQLSHAYLEVARRRNRAALDELDRCLDLNDWPGAPPGLLTVEPDPWLDTDTDDLDT